MARKLNVAIDFDGVISQYRQKYDPYKVTDKPVDGVIDYITNLVKAGHKVSIFSMRNANNDYLLDLEAVVFAYEQDCGLNDPSGIVDVRLDVASLLNGRKVIRDFLVANGMAQDVVDKLKFPLGKPHFDIFIDDRAYRYDGKEFPELSFDFCKPWNKT